MEYLEKWADEFKRKKQDNLHFTKDIFDWVEYKTTPDKPYCYNTTFLDVLFFNTIDVNMVCPNDDTGDTLLHRAAACANLDAVAMLLNVPNIDITIKNKNGLTPAQVICTKISVTRNFVAKLIVKDKDIYSTYTLLNEDYYSCQDPTFWSFKNIKDMFLHKQKISHDPAKLVHPQEVKTENGSYGGFAGRRLWLASNKTKKQKTAGNP